MRLTLRHSFVAASPGQRTARGVFVGLVETLRSHLQNAAQRQHFAGVVRGAILHPFPEHRRRYRNVCGSDVESRQAGAALYDVACDGPAVQVAPYGQSIRSIDIRSRNRSFETFHLDCRAMRNHDLAASTVHTYITTQKRSHEAGNQRCHGSQRVLDGVSVT